METLEENLSIGNSKEHISVEVSQLLEKYQFTSTMLKVIQKVSADLYSANTFEEIGTFLFEGLEKLGYAEDSGCKLGVYFKEEDSFEIVYFKHRHEPKSYFELKSKLRDLKMFTKLAIEKKETILIKDSYSEYALSIDPNLKSMSRRTMIFIPLFYKERLVGLFSYARGGMDSITEELKHFLECICKIVTIVIANLLRDIKSKENEKELEIYRNQATNLKNISNEIIIQTKNYIDNDKIYDEKTEKNIFESMVSINPKMQEIFEQVAKVAETDSTVLIEGATGTGKELLAKAIHNLSNRKSKSFVTVNCSAIPKDLMESEIFGHLKGSFTDAKENREGKVSLANGGTLFLDEIAELSLEMQPKLLRLLHNREYEPIGGKTTIIDIRVIAATNKDLESMIQLKIFRDDLFYRLHVVRFFLPPLKDRKDDIPVLVNYFIGKYNTKLKKNIRDISKEAMDILLNYDYPGNIRQLESIIENTIIFCTGNIIKSEDLPDDFLNKILTKTQYKILAKKKKEAKEKIDIIKILKELNGSRKKTSEELHISEMTLWRKMKKYRIYIRKNHNINKSS